MEYKSYTVSLQNLCNAVEKGKLIFDHPLQRKSGQWSKEDRDKLIDSAIRGYLIDRPLLANEGNKLVVVDGLQRITYFYAFYKDKFTLGNNLKPVIIDDFEYEIAGKKYSDLDDVVRERFDDYQFIADRLLIYTYEELRDLFDRRNSGKRLSKAQKMTTIIDKDFGKNLIELMDHDFFRKTLTAAQVRAAEDRQTLLQVLMVLSGYDYQGFDNKQDIPQFISWFQENPNEELLIRLSVMMDRLVDILPDNMLKKKLVVPLILIAFDKVYGNEDLETAFMDWLKDFYDNYSSQEKFLVYCKGATTCAENVHGRINFFLDAVNNLKPMDSNEAK